MLSSKSAAPNVSSAGDMDPHADIRYSIAAQTHYSQSLLGNKHFTIQAAMRMCNFTEKESKNLTLQMRIRHLSKSLQNIGKGIPSKKKPAVPSAVTICVESPMSMVTDASLTAASLASASTSSMMTNSSIRTAKRTLLGDCRCTSKQSDLARKEKHCSDELRCMLRR